MASAERTSYGRAASDEHEELCLGRTAVKAYGSSS
jgi:hypothetical protein